MAPKYYATVQYQEGKEINNTEESILYHLALINEGDHRVSSLKSGSVTFSFRKKDLAERFKQQSKQLEDIADIQIAELQ